MRVQGYEREKQNHGEAKMSKVTADQQAFIASSISRLGEIGELDESRGMRTARAVSVLLAILQEYTQVNERDAIAEAFDRATQFRRTE